MLCRKLLNTLDDNYHTAYIPNPTLSPEALYRAVIDELDYEESDKLNKDGENYMQQHMNSFVDQIFDGDPVKPEGLHDYQKLMNNKLIKLAALEKKVVLVIDEAQSMPVETLESLRLISNLETETRKLIHIVLFGQPELDRLLDQKNLRQLRQRISFTYHLTAMSFVCTQNYINHRIATAEYDQGTLFDDAAIKLVFRASRGTPRLVNILCHKALMAAYGKGAANVNKKHVKAAIKDTEGVVMPFLFKWYWRYSALALVNLLVVMLAGLNGVVA